MVDTPKPPPFPNIPLRLVRPSPPGDVASDLRSENERLRAELEREQALTQVLRNQLLLSGDPKQEDTVPGLGVIRPPAPCSGALAPPRASSRRAIRAAAGVLLALLLGAAAKWATPRYPGLVGPLHYVQQWVKEFQW